MFQVMATSIIPPVTVMCIGAVTATRTIAIASTSLGIYGAQSKKDVIVLPY